MRIVGGKILRESQVLEMAGNFGGVRLAGAGYLGSTLVDDEERVVDRWGTCWPKIGNAFCRIAISSQSVGF